MRGVGVALRLRPLVRVGEISLRGFALLGGLTILAFTGLFHLLRGELDLDETVHHLERFTVRILPLVIGGTFVISGVVAIQGLGYVSRYGATEVFGWAAGLSAVREVGPLMMGLLLAARVGARNTAELSTLAARERLDALRALGLSVERVVLGPRVVAITASSAILYPLAVGAILVFSFGLAFVLGDQRLSTSFHALSEYLSYTVILEGYARMVLFGGWAALCSTYFGTRVAKSAREIGAQVYAGSVVSVSGIVVMNLYLTFLGGP